MIPEHTPTPQIIPPQQQPGCKCPRQKYNLVTITVNKSGFVPIPANTNGYFVTSTGADIVDVNDQVYYPGVPGVSLGDSRTYGGNQNEIFVGNIKVAFRTIANPAIEIVFKVFID